MRLTPRSLKSRLLLLQSVVFGGLILLGAPFMYVAMSRALQRDRDTYLEALAAGSVAEYQALADSAEGAPVGAFGGCLPAPVDPSDPAPGATHRPRHLLVCTPEGVVLCSDGEHTPLAPEAVLDASMRMEPVFSDARWSAEVMRVIAWPFEDAAGDALVMEVGTSYFVIENVLGHSTLLLVGVELVALVMVVTGGYVLTRRAFQPIERAIRQVEGIDEENLSERLPVQEPRGEVDRLSAVINHMLDRLQRAFDAQRRFSSDVSHEIRSPLTALRGQIEVALRRDRQAGEYREVLVDSLAEVLRLAKLAEDLMSLARADAGVLPIRHGAVELQGLVHRVAERLWPAAQAKGIVLDVEAPSRITVSGDSGLLTRIVENLLDNALLHTPSGGRVTVRLKHIEERVAIEVEDEGEGIAPEHLDHVFERFYRVDRARSRDSGGSGLGLAIAREFARLHGGDIRARSAVGEGSCFALVLPAAAPVT